MLIERLNFTMAKKDVLALAEIFSKMSDGISVLFEICQLDDEKISFHAAWVLENVLISNPDLFSLNLSKIIEITPTLKKPSLKRHFCKMLNHAMEDCSKNRLPRDVCQLFKKLDMEPIVESCFEWMMDPAIKPAVKVHCMDILGHLSKRYDWIADELPHVITLQMLDGTPGLINKGHKVLETIRKRGQN